MVARLLRLPDVPKPADATDALALAITHIWRGGAQDRIDAAVAKATSKASTGRVR
jgi:crossover junction endodeoxyribonuclease RuvC